MLVARRLALGGGSETSSAACDTDISSGDLDSEVDVVMTQVGRDIKLERMEKVLRQLKAEQAAAAGGATPVAEALLVPAASGAAPATAAAAEEKPKKIKRGQIPGHSVKYDPRKPQEVSAYVRARTCMYLLVCTVTLEARI